MSKMKNISKKYSSLSIKYKIFLYLTGFCAFLIFLLWITQVVFMSRIYGNIRMSQMENCADRIEAVIKDGSDLQQITEIARNSDACAIVVGKDGSVIHSADTTRMCRIHKMYYKDILSIISSTENNGGELKGVYSDHSVFGKGRIVYNTRPDFDSDIPQSMINCRVVEDETGTLAYIILNIQLSPVDATVSTIQVQLMYITLIMVVFSAVLAGVISRRVSKPIEKLVSDVQQLATGDYETTFDASGYREINELSSTLTQTAEELGKVEKLRKDFIANVSHDLRTPLTLIGGYAEIMRDIPGENNPENAQMIIDETHRLSTLVNDLLDMSRIQSGAVPMEKKTYNLTRSVKQTVERTQELLKKQGYEIVFDYTDCADVTADEIRIQQCFYNMLINAVNYTGDDKKIYVAQEIYDGMVRISVTDTGSGVDEKEIPYIWERYYKGNKNHRRSVTGTGLGLSIVRSVIKSHNGMCGVYNAEGKGACFWFTIPQK